jgi:histidinol-phosphate aminotransferase
MTEAPSATPDLIRRYIRQDIQSIAGYAIQDATGMIKLDAMENPYRLSLELQDELGRRLGAVAINRYPTTCVAAARKAIAGHVGMPPGYDILLGNGSDELITMLSMVLALPGASVLAPMPGFVFYEMAAKQQGLDFVGVPTRPDFQLDMPAMLQAIAIHKPALIYLAYPNNPTANLLDDEDVLTVIAAAPGLVVMDEAYQPFSSRSFMDRLTQHPNVLLMRTLSKFGLAGVRMGYLIGPKALIAEIDKVRPPYNISALNAEATLFAIEHADVFAAQAAELREQRSLLIEKMAVWPGVTVFPSEANMILVRVPDADRTFAGMKAAGVLIKNVSKMHPLLANCLRLTVGTPQENLLMLAALKNSL